MVNMSTMRSVAETLLTALQSSMVKEVFSKWGFESELNDLIHTVSDVGSVLCAVEASRELAVETQEWVQKLKDAVYDADDLFDEILTVAALSTKARFQRNNKLPDKVRGFFSDNRMSSCVVNIRSQLDAMGNSSCISHSKHGFGVDYQIIKEREYDIRSCIDARNVIVGREDDMNAVIDLLFDTNFKDCVSYITIEGVPGMGKTALAQLVYRDQRVEDEFPLRLWVQFSNGDGGKLSAKGILGKILEAVGRFYTEVDNLLNIELTEQLRGKKYLIVLDDVCGEDQEEWLALRNFLMFSVGGSRIIVTTCSTDTVMAIGSEHTYELRGLSQENSWRLLEMTAFDKECKHVIHSELAEIVEMCEGFPPAIKELGSLIFSQGISKLSLSEEHALATNDEDNKSTNLIPDKLETRLKSCLSYCALFPKDFMINKKMLLELWMAQGYVVPLDGQTMVDAAEEYLSILLLSYKLQPVTWDEYGEVVYCKFQTQMFNIALDFGAQEICVVDSVADNMIKNVLHLHHIGSKCSESSFPKSRIRTYVKCLFDWSFPPLENLVSSWMCLRALDLHDLNISSLPESISKLLHLRYLDLSQNKLQRLPNSITKLHNLQTLKLDGCIGFEQLPWDIYKLVNLRSLSISNFLRNFPMPLGMDKLTCLHTLTDFNLAKESTSEEQNSSDDDSSYSGEQNVGTLKDLKALSNLRGSISISIQFGYKDVNDNQILEGSGGYLGGMEHLKEVFVNFLGDEHDDELGSMTSYHEDLLEKLQPHSNLKGVHLRGYQGTSFTRWSSSLPNLVKIKIESAMGLQHLSLLSKLQHLKSLTVSSMSSLMYMETANGCSSSDYAQDPSNFTFFPSLEDLNISYSPELKGLWEGDQQLVAADGSCWKPSFKRLFELSIFGCPKLESFPPCPRVKTLSLCGLDENFKMTELEDSNGYNNPRPSGLKNVNLFENIGHLNSLSMSSVTSLSIRSDHKVERLSQVKEAFKSCSSSLRRLSIRCCNNLRSVSQGLEYLTVLESLSIIECPVLTFSEEDDSKEDGGMPWRSLHQSLRSLELWKVESMTILPSGMQHLTALQDLNIECCWELKDLPDWIGCLSSLKSLRVRCCSEFQSLPETMKNLTSLKLLDMSYCKEGLKERCQNPNGEDWHKIKHIPFIIISE